MGINKVILISDSGTDIIYTDIYCIYIYIVPAENTHPVISDEVTFPLIYYIKYQVKSPLFRPLESRVGPHFHSLEQH